MYCYEKLSYYYDKLIKEDIDYKIWGQKILSLCDKFNINKDKYLDLACGTGNLTENIAPYFNETFAVDLSLDMLSVNEKKFRDKGLKGKFLCQDICHLNLGDNKFDLITCSLDSINYILDEKELLSFFNKVKKVLKDKGLFVFDINSYYKLTNIIGNNTFSYDDEDIFYIWENELNNNIVHMYLTFFIKEDMYYKRFDEEHIERAYKIDTIEEILKKCGLKIINMVDGYSEKEIDEKTERITFVVSNE